MASTAPQPAGDLPWPTLLTLGAATTVMVTAEMLPTAVLSPMSRGLGVTESSTGQLVAVWALTVVIASLPLTRATRRIDRRTLLVVGLGVLASSCLATAAAPSYDAVLLARLVGAASVGLLWASANAHVADLVPEALLGRAVAVVLGGATLGMVLGTPLMRLIADSASWRAGFVVLGAAAAVIALLVRRLVPPRERRDVPAGSRGSGSLGAAMIVIGCVGLLLVGFYGAYTFITRLGEPAAGLLPGGMSSLLLLFGVASAAGVAIAGRLSDVTTAALVATAALTAVALLGLGLAQRPVLGLVTVLALGVLTGSLPPLAQTEILTLAGEGHRDLAAALIPVVFNGGIAVGASVASLVVAAHGHDALPVPAALAAGTAALGLALAARARARRVRTRAGGAAPVLPSTETVTCRS